MVQDKLFLPTKSIFKSEVSFSFFTPTTTEREVFELTRLLKVVVIFIIDCSATTFLHFVLYQIIDCNPVYADNL